MAISVSERFRAAQAADVNKVAAQVLLVLGNYSNPDLFPGASAYSSGDDASGDFPAAGTSDGDRTEINVGPASGADNGVGRSSWRSSGVPDSGDDVFLVVDFGQERTFNRVKLYHLAGQGLSSYVLSYWDGTQWVDFAGTDDHVVPSTGIYGEGGFGEGPYGGGPGDAWGYGAGGYGDVPYGGQGGPVVPTQVVTSKHLDVVDTMADITATRIKLQVMRTEVAGGKANVVELEVYRKVDVTERSLGLSLDRRRDYRLRDNLASSCDLELDNSDRFFSVQHTPTSDERGDGFVNDELEPGILVIVKLGFDGELVTVFTGTADFIRTRAGPRTAQVRARDGVKGLIDQAESSKLRTAVDIRDAVRYLLNLANVSDYEMSLDETTIDLDYFFTFEQDLLSSLRLLVQAAGDAAFFFDEAGTATFRMYLNRVPQERLWTTQAHFQTAGTSRTNLDLTRTADALQLRWYRIDDFADAQFTSNPAWGASGASGDGAASAASGRLALSGSTNPAAITVSTTQNMHHIVGTQTDHSLTFRFKPTHSGIAAGAGEAKIRLTFRWTQDGTGQGQSEETFFEFDAETGNVIYGFKPLPGGSETTFIVSTMTAGTEDTWTVERINRSAGGGADRIYKNGVLQAQPAYAFAGAPGATFFDQVRASLSKTLAGGTLSGEFDVIGHNDRQAGTDTVVQVGEGRFESELLDQGASIIEEGVFEATFVAPIGTAVTFYTRTSPDGINFSGYQAVVPGSAIPSPAQRYLQWKADLVETSNAGFINDRFGLVIHDVTVNWFTGAGSAKAHASADFIFSGGGVLLDLDTEFADNLGGDSAVVNDAQVTSAPRILDGADTDTRWQGTNGVPAAKISASNARAVSPGTLNFEAVVSGGMDTSFMGGANPAAAVVTFGGGAAGSWTFARIHPTKPVLRVVVTVGGTITDLRVVGKAFTSSQTPIKANASDAASIARHGKRTLPVQNDFIINEGIAHEIADALVRNFKDATLFIPSAGVRPTFSMQLGDRATVDEENADVNADYTVVGVRHRFSVAGENLAAKTEPVLLKIA